MILFSKASKEKIYHLHDCALVKRVKTESLGYFDNHAHAIREGYRCCRRCDSIARQVAAQEKEIRVYCTEHGLQCLLEPGALVINTERSQWRIAPKEAYLKIQLFHRNTSPGKQQKNAPENYHPQKVKSPDIMGFLQYIVGHERYREGERQKKAAERQQKWEREQRQRNKVNKLRQDAARFKRNPKKKSKETFSAGQLYSLLGK